LLRTGWFRQAYVKTDGAYRLKLLLTHRCNLERKFLDLENAIRHSLKSFASGSTRWAAVAVARKLAVIMHAMWRDGTAYADRPHAPGAGGASTAKERKLLGVLA
jgi:hypothetical protein